MHKIKLLSDGIMFVDPITSKSIRTPYNFTVSESDLDLYTSYLKRNGLKFEIEEIPDTSDHGQGKRTQPLSIYRPRNDINFDLKINN